MKISDLKIGDWCIWNGRKYIKVNGSFIKAKKAVFMGLDLYNFGKIYGEDYFGVEVEFCPQWDYVNTNYKMTGKNVKSPYGSIYKLSEAIEYLILEDKEMDEVIVKRKYLDEYIYIVIWSKSPYNQGEVFKINKYNGKRVVNAYIEYHLDFEGNDFDESP